MTNTSTKLTLSLPKSVELNLPESVKLAISRPSKKPSPPPKKQKTAPAKPLSEKEKRIKNAMACKKVMGWLQGEYPLCFKKDGSIPLKIGILKDIFDALPPDSKYSRLSIRKALARYARSRAYREALTTHSHRYDLRGNEVGIISQEHKLAAQEFLIPAEIQTEK